MSDEQTTAGRPTCGTCPCWELRDANLGICHRFPPVIAPATDEQEGGPLFPNSLAYDWCGEHPDFPAWIASTSIPVAEETPKHSPGDTITINRVTLANLLAESSLTLMAAHGPTGAGPTILSLTADSVRYAFHGLLMSILDAAEPKPPPSADETTKQTDGDRTRPISGVISPRDNPPLMH